MLVAALLSLAGCEALPTGTASTDATPLEVPQSDLMPRAAGAAAEGYAEFAAAVWMQERSDALLLEARGRAAARGGMTPDERKKLEQESADLWKQAAARYRNVLARDPQSAAACDKLAEGYLDRGDAGEGIRWLKEAARLRPGEFATLYRLGATCQRAGRADDAIQAFTQAERAKPDGDDELRALPLIVLNLANLLESKDRLPEAADAYARFIKLPKQPAALYEGNPALGELLRNNGPILRKLGDLYAKMGKSREAVDAYREALKAQPQVTQALLRIAEAQRAAGNLPAALATCKEYVEREPNRLDGMAFLVDLYKSAGQTDQAVAAAQQFLREKPFLYQLHYLLGTLYEARGEVDPAVAEYEILVRDGKRFVPAYQRLADIETKRGKPEKALATLAKGLAAGVDDETFYGELDRRVVEAAKVPGVAVKFRLAVQPAEQDFAFYYVLGRLQQESKSNAEAAVSYREVIRLKPEFTQAVVRLASVLIADRKSKEAADVLRAAAAKERDNMLLWRFLADAELADGNPAGAADAMTRVVEIDPTNMQNASLLVSLLGRAGRFDAAQAFLEKKIVDNPDDATQWSVVLAAFLMERNRNLDRAVAALKDALDDDPDSALLNATLGRVYLKQENYADAADAFRRAVTLEPDNLGARAALALALEEGGKPAEAEKELRDALKAKPDSTGLMAELGQFLVRTKRAPDEGLALLRRAADAEADDPQSTLVLASAYTHLKRHAEALAVLTALVQKQPDFMPARYSLAMTWDALKDFPKAEAELKGILAKDPDDGMAANALGYMYAERGVNLVEAKRLVEVALKDEPENGAYLDSMGWVCYRLGDFAKALEYLTKAAASQKDAVVAEHLGDACFRLGRRDEALAHYEEACKLDTDGETSAVAKMAALKDGKDPTLVTK